MADICIDRNLPAILPLIFFILKRKPQIYLNMRKPPYDNFPVLSDDRVLLRQIKDIDLADLVDITFYDAVQANNLQHAKEMNAKIDRDYQDGKTIHWVIVDNSTRKIVGTCGYYRGFDNEQGELGCVLLSRYRGQGFMTSALSLSIDFGFNTIGLKAIIAITSQGNGKAVRLLERLGFVQIENLKDNKLKYQLSNQ